MDYEVEFLTELSQPSVLRHFYYPGASESGGKDGLMLRIAPAEAEPWIGTFAFGGISPKEISGVFSTPNPGKLCVVSRGSAYIVYAADPSVHEELHFFPILDARPVPRHGLIVFANFTDLLAIGRNGIRWQTPRLAWDGLTIVEISDNTIKGEFLDISTDEIKTFTVDLRTGECDGVIHFP